MMETSRSCPLQIGELQVEQDRGAIGLTLCPGKKDPGHGWDRDLAADLHAVAKWGASTVLTLIEDHEFTMLQVEALGSRVLAMGMDWIHLPIVDLSVPDQRFEAGWRTAGPCLHTRLTNGEKILIHCRGGFGRTGLVSGRILVERGISPSSAIERVRFARPGAIETQQQELYVKRQQRIERFKAAH